MRGLDETSADAGFVAWGSSARRILLALVLLFPISSDAWAWGDEGPRARAADGFDLVVLGALGGHPGRNLCASLTHPHGDGWAVTCDAGTVVNGRRVADTSTSPSSYDTF
jgi:hypothetical protein